MKMSKLFVQTLREFPSDAEVISHKMLVRAGYIRKLTSGVYNYLPLMWRVLRKVETIVREEMDNAGAQELLMPFVQPKELWMESGRWEAYGKELMKESGYDLDSSLFWYNKHKQGDYSNPLDSDIFLSNNSALKPDCISKSFCSISSSCICFSSNEIAEQKYVAVALLPKAVYPIRRAW